MMEPILELITSYQSRISAVEELVATAYQSMVASEDSFGVLAKERERLVTSLQQTLARNCSLRKKDFNHLIESLLSDFKQKREEIQGERTQVGEKINQYLEEQKERAICLREQLVAALQGRAESQHLEAVISDIKNAYQDTGQHLLVMLQESQLRWKAFQNEQEETNRRLQRLANRGESLKTEDLSQLETVKEPRRGVARKTLTAGRSG